jgi:hypothetical protein
MGQPISGAWANKYQQDVPYTDARCSSPQTTQISAGTRADTLMFWVNQAWLAMSQERRITNGPAD